MGSLWFWIVAVMVTVYVVLDGFDLGAGVIYLIAAKTTEERRDQVGQKNGVVTGRMHENSIEKIDLAQALARYHNHTGLIFFRKQLIGGDVVTRDRDAGPRLTNRQGHLFKHYVGRHHFGQAGDRHHLIAPTLLNG